MKLYLDTSNNLKTIIKLDEVKFTKNYQSPRDQDVIGALLEALKAQNKTVQDITSVQAFTGPGSFTGLRVGLSVANALSFALNIPVNGKKPPAIITPTYGKKPSITL